MITSVNHSLLSHNTFKMDVKSDLYIEYDSVDQLLSILDSKLVRGKRIFHIGAGSNVLFTGDFHGVVLHSAMKFIETINETDDYIDIKVGSGVVWDDFCRDMSQRGLWGVENLSGIPGEVGASAVQNIGAYGVEVSEVIKHVETIDILTGNEHHFSNAHCSYGYRYSIFKDKYKDKHIVTSVIYRLFKHPMPRLEYAGLKERFDGMDNVTPLMVREAVLDIRNYKLPDPSEIGSAGSFFKNPVVSKERCAALLKQYYGMPHFKVKELNGFKLSAAWLIDQCGLKGMTVGGAAVYEKQPLVLVNTGHAKPEDVIELASIVKKAVKDKFYVELYPEVNYI